MKEVKKDLTTGEKIIADEVADEILSSDEERERRRYFVLILIFLICLIFLIATLSFAIFDSYYNGGKTNVIDVGIDTVVDDDDHHHDDFDSVLFSFNEGSNYIDMVDVYPTSDKNGKKLSGDKQYFDFNISANTKTNKGKLFYEIGIVPVSGNTIPISDVRVHLTENGNDVSVTGSDVNDFSELPNSNYNVGAKVIYKNEVNGSYHGNYTFRMWLSSDASVADVSQKFACKIVVNAYYR